MPALAAPSIKTTVVLGASREHGPENIAVISQGKLMCDRLPIGAAKARLFERRRGPMGARACF